MMDNIILRKQLHSLDLARYFMNLLLYSIHQRDNPEKKHGPWLAQLISWTMPMGRKEYGRRVFFPYNGFPLVGEI